MKKNKAMIIGFLLPAVTMFVLIFLYPILRTIVMSFFKMDTPTTPVSEWAFVGFGNYTTLLNTPLFITSMVNIFKIWFIGGLIVMSISLLFGAILTSGIRFKKFFRAVIYMPNIVSAVALATMWLQYVYNNRYGLLTGFFNFLGLEEIAQTPWLSVDNKFMALLLAYCFGMVGYHMLIWISGIERIGADYYEAATIDGANKVKQFFYITIPLLKAVFKTNITLWTVSTCAFFVWSQLFSSVTAGESTLVPVQYMYGQIFGSGNAVTERNTGYGAAIGIVLCLCVVVVFTMVNKLVKKDDLEV